MYMLFKGHVKGCHNVRIIKLRQVLVFCCGSINNYLYLWFKFSFPLFWYMAVYINCKINRLKRRKVKYEPRIKSYCSIN